jgi:lysozyme family protein
VAKSERREQKFAPFDTNGWYGEHARSRKDPVIQEIIRTSGSPKVNPIGYNESDVPAISMSMSAVSHNPYAYLVPSGAFIIGGFFMLSALSPTMWVAVSVAIGCWLLGLWVFYKAVQRIPSWHRARRRVRAYLAENPGRFPNELRWFG